MALSPEHYVASLQADDRQPTSSHPYHFGKLLHALVLGGQFVVYEGERRGNAWKSFKAEHEGIQIVTADELAEADFIAKKLAAHPDASRLLRGTHEVELSWQTLGRDCLGHIDVLGDGFITDLKTTAIAKPERFLYSGRNYAYHAQLSFYQDAVAANFGGRIVPAFVVAVETSEPYPIVCFEMTERALTEGRKMCRLWLERLNGCIETNEWPGYVQSIVPFDIPEDVELLFDEEAA